jgi:hypothetical protein
MLLENTLKFVWVFFLFLSSFELSHGLQAHPGISEQERKRLCRMMDCQRLSLEACMHAAENERLPLRVVIQVRKCIGLFASESFCYD